MFSIRLQNSPSTFEPYTLILYSKNYRDARTNRTVPTLVQDQCAPWPCRSPATCTLPRFLSTSGMRSARFPFQQDFMQIMSHLTLSHNHSVYVVSLSVIVDRKSAGIKSPCPPRPPAHLRTRCGSGVTSLGVSRCFRARDVSQHATMARQ